MPEVQPLVAPPRILAQSHPVSVLAPRQAATAALTEGRQLNRQIAHAQVRVQHRRTLPVTQLDFYQQRQKPSPKK